MVTIRFAEEEIAGINVIESHLLIGKFTPLEDIRHLFRI